MEKAEHYKKNEVREDLDILLSIYGFGMIIDEEPEVIQTLFENTFGYWLPISIYYIVLRE